MASTPSNVSDRLADILLWCCLSNLEFENFSGSSSDLTYASLDLIHVHYNVSLEDKCLDKISEINSDCNILADIDARNLINCRVHSLNDWRVDNAVNNINEQFNMVHLIIRSLPAHLDELEVILETLMQPIIVGLCQTWLEVLMS